MAKRTTGSKYFKNFVEKNKAKLSQTLKAHSPSGLVHTFQNAQAWQKYADDQDSKKSTEEISLIISATAFLNFLKSTTIDQQHITLIDKPTFYKFASQIYGPFSVMGSAANGGRFNIGGAQMRKELPDLNFTGCLYVSDSKECCLAEAALPVGQHKLYKMESSKEFKLWNLNSLLPTLNYPNITDLVRADSGEKIWGFVKVPHISQLLSSYLKNIGGDGVFFESTRHPGPQNYAIFYNDEKQVTIDFKATILN